MALIVNDLNETKHFYGDIIGMKELFTYRASKDYDILYMGHPQYPNQSAQEMMAKKNEIKGLMEFVSLKVGLLCKQDGRTFTTVPHSLSIKMKIKNT